MNRCSATNFDFGSVDVRSRAKSAIRPFLNISL
jgi:hypothetical protein